MKTFKLHQRIRIANPCHDHLGLDGWTGKVVRLRMLDDGAWVEMDRNLPAALSSFPEDDPRHRHLRLYPEECKPTAKQ